MRPRNSSTSSGGTSNCTGDRKKRSRCCTKIRYDLGVVMMGEMSSAVDDEDDVGLFSSSRK